MERYDYKNRKYNTVDQYSRAQEAKRRERIAKGKSLTWHINNNKNGTI